MCGLVPWATKLYLFTNLWEYIKWYTVKMAVVWSLLLQSSFKSSLYATEALYFLLWIESTMSKLFILGTGLSCLDVTKFILGAKTFAYTSNKNRLVSVVTSLDCCLSYRDVNTGLFHQKVAVVEEWNHDAVRVNTSPRTEEPRSIRFSSSLCWNISRWG